MQQHRFRIDREPDRDPANQRWRARTIHDGMCSEFSIAVNFERLTVDLNGLRCAFQLLGTNLSRELSISSAEEDHFSTGRFRARGEGSWTVLEAFMPGQELPSFDLALNATYGQGMLVIHDNTDPRLLQAHILAPQPLASQSQDMGLIAQWPDRAI